MCGQEQAAPAAARAREVGAAAARRTRGSRDRAASHQPRWSASSPGSSSQRCSSGWSSTSSTTEGQDDPNPVVPTDSFSTRAQTPEATRCRPPALDGVRRDDPEHDDPEIQVAGQAGPVNKGEPMTEERLRSSAGSTTTAPSTSDGRAASGRRPVARRRPRRRAGLLPQAVRRPGGRGRPPGATHQGRRAVAGGAAATVTKVRATIVEAQAVGDLDALVTRLDALRPVIEERARCAKPSVPQRPTRPRPRRRQIAEEAEKLATGNGLAQRRQPASRAAQTWKGPPPHRQAQRRRALAPVLVSPHDVHPPTQAALRRAQREARGARVAKEKLVAEAEELADVDRLGSDRPRLPRPDDAVEGRRAGAEGRGRRAVEALPRCAGHVLRCPRRGERRSSTRSTPQTPR